jgi:hypothetical protein
MAVPTLTMKENNNNISNISAVEIVKKCQYKVENIYGKG